MMNLAPQGSAGDPQARLPEPASPTPIPTLSAPSAAQPGSAPNLLGLDFTGFLDQADRIDHIADQLEQKAKGMGTAGAVAVTASLGNIAMVGYSSSLASMGGSTQQIATAYRNLAANIRKHVAEAQAGSEDAMKALRAATADPAAALGQSTPTASSTAS